MSIRVENITKVYGEQKALDNLSFSIGNGELIGFLGPNGAGKSTLMKIITGYQQADRGKVFVNDELVVSDNIAIRSEIGYLPEHNPLYPDLFVKEYLSLVAGFYRLKNRSRRVAEMIEMTGLGEEQHKKIGALSKGYRQRVGLAQALIHNPSILILDEPTTGLDPNQLDEIRSLIGNISRDKTVLFSTHIMQEVEAICQRVLIIDKGILVADSRVDELKTGRLRQKQQVLVEFEGTLELEKLRQQEWVETVAKVQPSNLFLVEASGVKDIRPCLFHFAVDNQLTLLTIQEQKKSLENVFHELTTHRSSTVS